MHEHDTSITNKLDVPLSDIRVVGEEAHVAAQEPQR